MAKLMCPVWMPHAPGSTAKAKSALKGKRCEFAYDLPRAEGIDPMSLVALFGGEGMGSHLRVGDSNRAELALAEHLEKHTAQEFVFTITLCRQQITDLENDLKRAKGEPIDHAVSEFD